MIIKRKTEESTHGELRNEDALTGEPGSHPMGTGLGAAIAGAAAGAATGTLAGPVGTVLGTIVGGVAGAYAGKAIAENIDPTAESNYWRATYSDRPYYSERYHYDDYEPAYRAGWEAFDELDNPDWQRRESVARERWESEGGPATMKWDQARLAAEDAYRRVAVHSKT